MSRAQVIVLGSGTPNAEADRAGPAIAIAVEDEPYLVDCGAGVVRRAVQARQRGLINWTTTDLTRLFVTHLHADHTVGLPDLLYTPWIHERESPLHVWGPSGMRAMLQNVETAWQANIREHLTAHPVAEQGYKARFTPVSSGVILRDERVEAHALRADHGALEAYSYKFVAPDKTVVISGDTKPARGFADWARGCDILLHEVYSADRLPERDPAWQAYHSRVHTSTRELAALAQQVQPTLLVLTHQLFWGATPAELVAEVQAGYAGRVVSANDLDVF